MIFKQRRINAFNIELEYPPITASIYRVVLGRRGGGGGVGIRRKSLDKREFIGLIRNRLMNCLDREVNDWGGNSIDAYQGENRADTKLSGFGINK